MTFGGGLKWTDLDLTKGVIRIQRQLVMLARRTRVTLGIADRVMFGPVKGKTPRTMRISAELVSLLRRHKAHQRATKAITSPDQLHARLRAAGTGGRRRPMNC